MNINKFYDYFEERPLSNTPQQRTRKTMAVVDPQGFKNFPPDFQSSFFTIWYYHQLENPNATSEGDPRETAWAMTSMRLARYIGDPGKQKSPERPEEIEAKLDLGEVPPSPYLIGSRIRTHHYYRVLSAADVFNASRSTAVNISLELTEEWFDPPDGIVSPIAESSIVQGTHCIGMLTHEFLENTFGVTYPQAKDHFVFRNSWGLWGYKGFGAISGADIDRFLVEGYASGPLGFFPPIE